MSIHADPASVFGGASASYVTGPNVLATEVGGRSGGFGGAVSGRLLLGLGLGVGVSGGEGVSPAGERFAAPALG